MSRRVVFWTGPVNLAQVPGATVSGATMINIPCTGDGAPTCATRAEGWLGADGRRLPNVPGIKADDEVFIGTFSAGGSVAKRLALNAADRAQMRAILLADSTYSDWISPGKPNPPEGFVLYGLDAIAGPHLFVATASASPNKDLPNGAQTLESIRLEIERRSGLKFQETTAPTDPPPVKAWKLGNILFADYQMVVPHGGQAKLAPQLWQKVLQPWLDGNLTPPKELPIASTESGWGLKLLAGAAGAAAGFMGARWAQRRGS